MIYIDSVAKSAVDVCPPLNGTRIPYASLTTANNSECTLESQLRGKPTVLVFYRGSWCQFGMIQLAQLRELQPELQAFGYQTVAISPDTPSKIRETAESDGITFKLLSDSRMLAAKAFDLAYHADDGGLEQRGVCDDIKSATKQAVLLPVPAVFLVSCDGFIQFQYVNPDPLARLHPRVLLTAVAVTQSQ